MEISIPQNSLRRSLEDEKKRVKKFGKDLSSKIGVRMAGLEAAETLADFWPPFSLPERCHELKGELKGVFSVDLKHPYRLLFRPTGDTGLHDSELDRWRSVKSVEIVGIEDTHG